MIRYPPVFPYNQIILIMKIIRNLGFCQQINNYRICPAITSTTPERMIGIAITPGKAIRSPVNQILSITDRLNAMGISKGAESRSEFL